MIITSSKAEKEHVQFLQFPLCSPVSVLCNILNASLAFYRLSITGLKRVYASTRGWHGEPPTVSESGFNPAEWTETKLRLPLHSKWIVSCFLFLSHKMRGGGYLLALQAGPGLHDLPLVPGDPKSGEEDWSLNKDLWCLIYCLCATIDVTHDEKILLLVMGECLNPPFLYPVIFFKQCNHLRVNSW